MTLPIATGDVDLAAFLEELRLWVEMETPSGDAAAVNRLADRIEVLARDARFSVERTAGTLGFGDILAVRTPRLEGYNARSVLILAHIDTVHATGTIREKLPLREDGDRLYGPGIYDMKAGVLMAFEAMKLATKMGHNLPIDLLIVPDEEVGSKSSRPLIEELARNAAYALVVEPARDGGKIVTARKGVGMFDIIVRGRASHAGVRPLDGRSAIRAAARLVLELEALNDPVRGITVTTGMIHGGTGRNTIPAECRLQLDLRLPDAAIAAEVIDKIRGMTPVDPDITFEISGDLNRPPFAQSEEGRRLFDHTARIAAELGIMLEGMVTGGGSDGNFTAALGVPTLDGLGADGAGAHTFDEHILVSSLVPRTVLLANLMASLDSKA
ncbi:M20 family metallopeptidase [Pseudorhizobium marinum]|uniref:M20 family metallopeptidase n=1 Tax=Pseudorhizobium marinum TaxID=1496690 RepID=UPI000494FE44|nr:M20 family metallopeptidase [Pseudorhizobium marinum]MBU1312481.1 M20 family metallopeptidase [Alphaproteobacteria bacterium]MBU1553122.1 M20 family metallopeptidase [Alphaproteobacteria bacterium]MBU2338097.1 M20 family metallopeptidase [Alphaproteobacteria bacterium]MBU2386650.1 M20 family metallopeptidase [Alphaproteobacteria bacterium]